MTYLERQIHILEDLRNKRIRDLNSPDYIEDFIISDKKLCEKMNWQIRSDEQLKKEAIEYRKVTLKEIELNTDIYSRILFELKMKKEN